MGEFLQKNNDVISEIVSGVKLDKIPRLILKGILIWINGEFPREDNKWISEEILKIIPEGNFGHIPELGSDHIVVLALYRIATSASLLALSFLHVKSGVRSGALYCSLGVLCSALLPAFGFNAQKRQR